MIVDHQALWDRCIIMGWKSDLNCMAIIKHFLLEANPSLLILGGINHCETRDIDEVIEYINSLEIKRRCRDRNTAGNIAFVYWYGGVRAFIAQRSPQLFGVLTNKTMTPDDVLLQIDNFKWTRVNHSLRSKAAGKRQYTKKKASCEKTIKARELSKKHDWATVK